jgi:putative flippase GtrA
MADQSLTMLTFSKAQLASLLATAVDFGIAAAGRLLQPWYVVAAVLGIAAGGVVHFSLGRHWVFGRRGDKVAGQSARYRVERQPAAQRGGGTGCYSLGGAALPGRQSNRVAAAGRYLQLFVAVSFSFSKVLKKLPCHCLRQGARWGLVAGLCLPPLLGGAQTTLIRGVVRSAATREPLPSVNVTVPGTTRGTSTDPNGVYALEVPAPYLSLTFTYIGYRPETRMVVPGREQVVDVALTEASQALPEVVVKSGRARYRNKDNPAVDLIRLVIDHKERNRSESYDYVEYEKYEKMSFALSNLSERFRARRVFRNYQFLFKRDDSARIGSGSLLPVYLEEKLSKVYFRRRPEKTKTRVQGQKQVQFDKHFIDNGGVSAYFNRMYQDIDIYDNNISVLSNQFLSPIAGNAPTFYKFYITDTVKNHVPPLAELSFSPRNRTDLLFEASST